MAGGEHAGQEGLVTVHVQGVKERELPDADDEFAELASEFDTIEELRESLSGEITLIKGRNQLPQAQEKLLEHLLEVTNFPVPAGLLQSEVERHISQLNGAEPTGEQLEQINTDSEREIRSELIADALVEKLQITASSDELARFIVDVARSNGADPSLVLEVVQRQGELPHFYGQLVRQKAMFAGVLEATVEDSAGLPVDIKALAAQNQGAYEEAASEDASEDPIAQELVDEALLEEVNIDLGALAEAEEEA
jgi:trigger factor